MRTRNVSFYLLLTCFAGLQVGLVFREPDRPMLPDFDKRLSQQRQVLDPQRQAAADALRTKLPTVRKIIRANGDRV